MTDKTPVAFMSYAHADDKDNQVTKLRKGLSAEAQMQIGSEFPIFQDRDDIKWGQNWRERIDDSVDQVTFLIPIITPSFFNSTQCRGELERFIEREKKLKRNDLILPVYFVDTPLLNDPERRRTDELAEVIASRQYADWRKLRSKSFSTQQVKAALIELAEQIRDALHRNQTTQKPATKLVPPTFTVDPSHGGDFLTITEAIKAVPPRSRIFVRPGRYQEGLVIDKPLQIIGDGEPGESVVEVGDMTVIVFQTTMGRIANLHLRQIGIGQEFCVKIVQGSLELKDCNITSQSSLSCVAICGDGADPRLYRNSIHHSRGGSGVLIYDNAQGTLEDNYIFGNAHSGVAIKDGANPILKRNRIHHNAQSGVSVYDGGRGILENNEISSNNTGISSCRSGNPSVRHNRINANADFGICVYENGSGTFTNNDLTRNAKGEWSIASDSEANVTRVDNKE
jgi:parallel beta-helix repeat protein